MPAKHVCLLKNDLINVNMFSNVAMTLNTLCLSIQRRNDPDRWAVRICPSRFEPVRVPPVCWNRPVRALQHMRRQPEPESKPAYLAFSRYDLRFDLESGNSGGGLSVGRTTWTTNEDCCGWSLLKERGKVNFRKWNVSLLLLCCFVFFMCCWRVVLQRNWKDPPTSHLLTNWLSDGVVSDTDSLFTSFLSLRRFV